MVSKNDYLTEMEQKFVIEYTLDPTSVTQAAIRAGYSADTASSAGSRTFNRPKVQAAIKAHQDAAASRLGITKDRILKELALIGFAPVTNLIGKNTEGEDELSIPTSEQPQEVTITTTKGNKAQRIVKISTVKLADKRAALVDMAKHLGMFVDKVEVKHLTLDKLIEESFAYDDKDPDPSVTENDD